VNQVLDLLGDLLGLVFVLVCLGLIVGALVTGRGRPGVNLREIGAFQRLRREVGLAVESGRRLHISLGRGNLFGTQAGSALVGLTLLDRCARAASSSDRPPVATSGDPLVAVLSQDTLRGAYRSLNVEGRYDPSSGRVGGLTPFSYAAGAMIPAQDEQVTANLLCGHFGAEAALIVEAGERKGSLSVASSDSLTGQAVLLATAQEPLIGEDLYAGGAYLGAGPVHAASLRMQDIMRWVLIAAMLLGALLKLGGVL